MIQNATHQFFLTERSLYLVVLNGRAGAEDEDAEYWLKFVKMFGASSPTIVVLNKFKVQPFQVNRRALRGKYPFIRAFVETDCKPNSKNGIPDLKREIESALAAMDHVRANFPVGWFQIKERLAEMQEPFISFAEGERLGFAFLVALELGGRFGELVEGAFLRGHFGWNVGRGERCCHLCVVQIPGVDGLADNSVRTCEKII